MTTPAPTRAAKPKPGRKAAAPKAPARKAAAPKAPARKARCKPLRHQLDLFVANKP